MLALAGPAVAGGELHLTLQANEETHTVDTFVGDDGSTVLLVDGQPVEAPAAPELPAQPTLP